MASDVIGLNCVFSSGKEIKYSDHLLENNILDEPLYENGEIIQKNFQANNKFSKSLMRIHEGNLNPSKEENIYENITYRENKLNSINEIKSLKPIPRNETQQTEGTVDEKLNTSFNIQGDGSNKDNLTGIKGLYTSTFSLTIGKPMTPTVAKIPEEKELNINITTSTNNSQDSQSSESSDNETFKSSYAKSLLDSFRKNTPNSSSAIINQNSSKQSPVIQQEIKTPLPSTENQLNSINMTPKVFKPILNPECPNKSIERLENKISSLTDNILVKDKELEKLRQEVMFLKLECNRVKAENRSLKASLNSGLSSRSYVNGDTHTPHSPVSSISGDSDTWTLQQQVAGLNSQLEKAELSRHAYEAATKQLVHFLQTINSTLTTVGGSDSKLQSPFTSQNTSELLTNLESTLLENRSRCVPAKIKTNPYFDSSRDGTYVAKVDIHSPPEVDRHYQVKNDTPRNHDLKTKDISNLEDHEHQYMTATSRNTSNHEDHENPQYVTATSRNTSYQSPNLNLINSSINEDSESGGVHIKEAVVHKIKSPSEGKEEKKRSNPQRRFSISQKLFNSTKRPLVRSGSVNNLPTDLSPVPRVSRAVSTHCVALGKIETAPSESNNDVSEQTNSNSNRMKTSKTNNFFSSLKNLFKPDDRSSNEVSKKKAAQSAPAPHRSNKVKSDAPPLSLHLNVPPSASTNLKKRHSMKTTLSVAREPSPDGETASTPNSTFYVPFHDDGEDRKRIITPDKGTVSPSATSSAESNRVAADAPSDTDIEMSGPREISLSLPRAESLGRISSPGSPQREERTPPPSLGAPFNCNLTGGGLCTGTDQKNDSIPKSLLIKGEGIHVERYRRVDEIKSLELDDYVVAKKKLPRAESCKEFMPTGLYLKSPPGTPGPPGAVSRVIRRRKTDIEAIGLKFSLWKLSRESYRAKECRLAFV